MSFVDSLKKTVVESNKPVTLELTQENISVMATDSNWMKPSNSSLYEYYNGEYSDDSISIIDKNKNITLSSEQINLTQERNSQYIPFQMPRYYDGFDLSKTQISVFYVLANGNGGYANVVDVYYNNDKIKFALLVDENMTALAGKIKFEIHAEGTNSKGYKYTWKTKANDGLNVIQALEVKSVIEPDTTWQESFISRVSAQADRAETAANNATSAMEIVNQKVADLQDGIEQEVQTAIGNNYYTKTETDTAIKSAVDAVDVTEKLKDYAKTADVDTKLSDYAKKTSVYEKSETYNSTEIDEKIDAIPQPDLSGYALKTEIPSMVGIATESFVKEEISKVDISEKLKEYAKSAEVYTKDEVDSAIKNVDVATQLEAYAKSENVYSKSEIDSKESALSSAIQGNTDNVSALSSTVQTLQEKVDSVDTSPKYTYDVVYNDPDNTEVGENGFGLYQIQNEGQENEIRELKKKFTIVGGSSGGATSSTLKIGYVTTSPVVATADDKVLIKYNFSGVDSSGDEVTEGTYTWKIGTKVIATGIATNGENTFDATDYVSIGTQKLTLQITDDAGSLATKPWTVQIVDVRLESSFNDTQKYSIGKEVSFNYTPYGAIQKTIHFKVDGEELYSFNTASSGIPMSYNIQPREHGAHLVEVYITAEINNSTIESNHIFKDVIWFDEESDVPVIGCTSKDLTIQQHNTANITFTVFDASTETPSVDLAVDGEVIQSLVLEANTYTWQYKATEIGSHVLTITSGQVVKTINVEVEELDIDVSPVTAGLEFDFNPIGYSNSSADRLWSDGDVTMTVSDNFDWVNGGYQVDENGDQYFCVKSGTSATINYNLFEDDPKRNGKEFKVIFKTTKIKKRDTSFISCMDSNIGLDMKIEKANIYSNNGELFAPYCEDDIIEFEFNINKDTDIPMVLTYEDGVGNRPMIYTSDSSFMQTNPQPITIGSEDCDVYIYRMKAYSNSLTDRDIKNNFIADARNAEEMISRYERNQIYDENGSLDPYVLAEKCPDLRIILVDCPHFTTDKSDKVKNTNITMIYKNGDPILDNWTCVNAAVSGQGTSSNEYGYAARNLDLIMNYSDSLITFGDGETTGKTITFTRDSIPVNYLNFKANVASSENQNNAQMTMRYNQYNPYIRPARLVNPNKRDTMAFYNAVVFVREYDADLSTHKEFNDNDKFHYYALGNIGDSKKTDSGRVFNADDPKEHCIEIMDYNVALAEFPTGYTDKEGNKAICPESEWKAGNTAYDALYAEYKYKDGKFKSFGSESYEFRYEKDGITTEERQANIDAWREAYKFVVTSDDETFKSDFNKYFVQDSVLFYYLFVERYTLVDNLAKNCFPQYAKAYFTKAEAEQFKETYGVEIQSKYIDDELGAFNDGYRYNWTQGYDFDTTLGISNTGKLEIDYGKELVDYNVDGDSSSALIFRAGASTFWCRIRDLFASELEALFVECESNNAWSASGLISQWDQQQQDFPEELWRLDIQRKYLRTYQGISVDNSIAGTANPRFLTEMLNGRKKYQRRMFERNQELYMATKYFGNRATSEQIMMRFNNPVGVEIKPNFTLKITPYSNMYIAYSFSNTSKQNIRAKAGVEYTIPYSGDTADITLIYGASFVQALGDLSKCYVGDNDFSKATRIQRIELGSDDERYSNPFMTKITLGSNELLEYLDIRRVTGLNSVVDLSNCNKLMELRAEKSGATGVIFSNGGKLQKAYLPSISSLTVKNLNDLEVFDVESYDNLLSLIVENTPFLNTYDIVSAADKLNILRLIGMDWGESYNLSDSSILDRLLTLRGIGNDGYTTSVSMLTGKFHASIVKQKQLEDYNNAWKNLDITYNTLIEQFPVTFENDDHTVLEVQYVDKGGNAVDPITREENPMPVPTKPSTVSTDHTFSGWSGSLTNVFAPRTITATYTESVREYSITYKSKGITLPGYPKTGKYGENIPYTGDIPTYTSEESGYNYQLFTKWDKSGIIDGDKVVNAVFDSCQYSDGYFNGKDLSTLRPVEIYALTQLAKAKQLTLSDYVTDNDTISISFGNDYNYEDVTSVEIVADGETQTFSGSNYYETDISLLNEDQDFVLAVDYKMAADTASDCSLVQCYKSNAVGKTGFRMTYNKGTQVTWGTSSTKVDSGDSREMLVLRHKKGETGLHVYHSNLDGTESTYVELSGSTALCTSTLVFGCTKKSDGSYENFAKGSIYWAKLWYGDLGDYACRQLAMWTHEKKTLRMGGFKMYNLSADPDAFCSMTFLAETLMDKKAMLSTTSTNTGGWAATTLNEYMNSRMYQAIDPVWRQIIKQVSIPSTIGNKSSELSYSNCYLSIPSVIELGDLINYGKEPYTSEGQVFSFMTQVSSRIRCYDDGTADEYWTRSPNATQTDYFHVVNAEGKILGGFKSLTEKIGVLIQLSI